MAITTKDLAQLCGVSRTTIHRALNGTGRIKPETKEMILQVAKEHGYRPDLLATGLAKGQTYNIGVVVLDVKNRYFCPDALDDQHGGICPRLRRQHYAARRGCRDGARAADKTCGLPG